MKKRAVSLLLSLCILLCYTITADALRITDSSAVRGSDYTNRPLLAEKLDRIFDGDIDIYAERSCVNEVSMPLGFNMDTSKEYTVKSQGKLGTLYFGYTCFIYALAVYNVIADESINNGNTSSLINSEIVLSGGSSLTYDMLKDAGVVCGAYIRTTKNSDGSFHSSEGHSMIILSYNENEISYINGNADGKGLVCITKSTYAEFNNDQLTRSWSTSRYICYIIQPRMSVYDEWYPACPNGTHEYVDGDDPSHCIHCGAYYDHDAVSDTSAAGSYKVVSAAQAKKAPYSSSETNYDLETGSEVDVVCAVTNSLNKKWYKLQDGSYVDAEALEKADDIILSDYNYPSGSLLQGLSFGVYGKITSGVSNISKVTVAVYDKDGVFKTGVENSEVNSLAYDIAKKADPYVSFGKLTPGTYNYRIIASNASKTVELLSKEFAVIETSPDDTLTLTGYTAPSTLYFGDSFAISGTVTSAMSKITKVTTAVYDASDELKTGKEDIAVNSKTYNLANADQYLVFNLLDPGEYHYKVIATNTSNKDKVLLDRTFTVIDVTRYRLDVNGVLDGEQRENIAGYGKFDIYVNGTLRSSGVSDFTMDIPEGCTYEIKNIIAETGREYVGIISGSLSGTVTGDTVIELGFSSKSYGNTVYLWAWGFKNNEGNNWNKAARLLGETPFFKLYGEAYIVVPDMSRTALPNGYYLDGKFQTNAFTSNGKWDYYDYGYNAVQPDKTYQLEFDCYPCEYTVTYELDGGTNSVNNPSTYTVLYGVTFEAPVKEGYIFTGWTDKDGNAITGINPGANADHGSASELYAKLKDRMTGNITVYANWKDTAFSVMFDANGGINAPERQRKMPGKTLTLSSDIPSYGEYVFKGWASDKRSKTAEYAPGSMYGADADITLYAVWDRCPLFGDLNGDGEADTADAVEILMYDAGLEDLSEETLLKADLNGDGEVNTLDASMLFRYDAGLTDAI